MTRILIIGTGECGVRAAFALREQGFDGAITSVGNESTLPYERPPISKSKETNAKPIRTFTDYTDKKINLRLGCAVTSLNTTSRTIVLDSGGASLE